ncbi:MAG TPA: dTMP kinase [Bacteroidales bacterium]|nr:dTMP kinase [Bacteroidales bacterium]
MKLLVIEGIDGAGKSTQIKLLREFLKGAGYKNEYLHFPRTDAPYFGELIARFLRGEFGSLGDVDPYLVAMLYAGDRKDAASVIDGWLKEKKMVLLDRYTYSNIAYQCAKISNSEEQDKLMRWIFSLEFSHFSIPKPDLNIFLDVPFSFTERKLLSDRTGSDRAYLNGIRDIHEESLSFQRKVRDMYIKVSDLDSNLAIINCSDTKDEILPPQTIFDEILNLLRKRNII